MRRRVGVTGHQRLGDAATVAWVEGAIDGVLQEQAEKQAEKQAGALVGVTNLAAGADQLFAERVLARGGELEVVLPFAEYRERLLTDDVRERFDRLLARARAFVLPRAGRSDEQAYMEAGREVVARCDLLVAVWDGKPSAGLGGTADVVAHARARGHAVGVPEVVVIDPVRRALTR